MLSDQKEKQRWAEEHAVRIGRRFEPWQRPFDIDGDEYVKYLTKELFDCCDEPLWQAVIESIS